MNQKDWDTLKSSPKYGLWRANVYARDNWKCRICSRKGGKKGRIEAHHIYPLRSHFHLRFEKGNGITLCVRCHRLIGGKELLVAKWLKEIIKNGVNSGNIPKDNPEPSRDRNFSEGATTRRRGYRIEQFVKKQVRCYGCKKSITRHYYRVQKGKRYFCSYKCRGKRKWMKVWNKRAPEKRKCSFCKKLMSITPSQPHRQKKFCNNSCHTKWMWKNGKEPPTYLNGKWSMQHDCCKNCKGKNKRHFGKGLCMTCYNIQYNASKSPTKTLPERDDIV